MIDPLDWAKLASYSGIHGLYRDLIRLRRNWFNQTRGLRGQNVNVHHINNIDKVIAFHRWENGGPGDDVVVVANFGYRDCDSYTIGFPRAGWWRVRLMVTGKVKASQSAPLITSKQWTALKYSTPLIKSRNSTRSRDGRLG
jgi:1,4-alpha-glucan branching enzyme